MEETCEHHCWKKHAQDINVIHSYSRLNKSNSYSIGVTSWLWFNWCWFQLELQLDVEERTQNRLTTLGDLSSWTEAPWSPCAPTQRWWPISTGARWPERGALQAWPARRRALWLVFEVKRTLCTATILLALWCGFDTYQTRGLGNSGITPQWDV